VKVANYTQEHGSIESLRDTREACRHPGCHFPPLEREELTQNSMDSNSVSVSKISWRDICPALILFRALPVALTLTSLLLALMGAVLAAVGWLLMQGIFISDEMSQSDSSLMYIAGINRTPHLSWMPDSAEAGINSFPFRGVELVYTAIVQPVREIFGLAPGLRRFLYFFGGTVWTLAVWSFFGCAISRVAMMRLTRDEPIGLGTALRFAVEKSLSCMAGIALPLAAVFGLALPLALTGLVMSFGPGAFLAGLFWVLVLCVSFVMAVILLGLTFAWPLVVGAIACEGQDSFDAMSRAFAYVFQRPIHYFAYALIGILFSGFCWLIAFNVAQGTIHLAWWATSWGATSTSKQTGLHSAGPVSQATSPSVLRLEDVRPATGLPGNGESGDTAPADRVAMKLIRFWENAARTLAAAFLYGLFWSIASAAYLLLRKDLDNTEMDEIWLVDQRRTYELPPLKPGDSGIPAVDSPDSGP
jgi:hypothetical protein